jgi:hypothetical protein
MEKETLISELTTRIGETPLSERSLQEYAEAILPTVPTEGEIPQSFWDTHVKILSSIGGQLRHDNKSAIENFRTTWEKEHQTKPAASVTPPASTTPPTPPTGFEEIMRKLLEEQGRAQNEKLAELQKSYETSSTVIQQLQEKLANKERQEREAAQKSAVVTAVKKLGDVNEAVLDLTLSQLQITESTTIEQLVESAKAIYGKEYKRFFGDAAVPFKGAGEEERDKTNVDSYIAKMKERQASDKARLEEQRKTLL